MPGSGGFGILSFDARGIHPHDVAQVLDQHGVAVRAGHHCAQPLMDKLGLAATTRASLGVYNDEGDIDALAAAIEAAQEMFRAMMDLRELYQDIILDHGRHPRNFRPIEHPTHFAHGHNPLCGDRVTVYCRIDGDHINDVSFEGRGCAISTASASLMTEMLKGKTLAEAERSSSNSTPRSPAGSRGSAPPRLEEDTERLEPLTGVKAYPARVKCATLPGTPSRRR